MFVPYGDKIEIRPIKDEGVFHSESENYEERGEVVSIGQHVEFVKPGDIVYFVAYGCLETPEVDGVKHYVVSDSPEFIIGKDVTE